MLQSHVIEVDGRFVGAAVRQAGGYRLVAVDGRLATIDGSIWASLADMQRGIRRLILAGGSPVVQDLPCRAVSGLTISALAA